jgi:lysophospholipase L1-like esterase
MTAIHSKAVSFCACLAIVGAATCVSAEESASLKAKASPDGKILWYDCRDIGVEGKGWSDTQSFYDRLPAKAEGKAPAAVWGLSHASAGMCVRFTTDARSFHVRWTLRSSNLAIPHMPATGVSGVDVYTRARGGPWQFSGNGRPTGVTNTATFATRPGDHCLLYLPLYNGVASVEVGVAKGHTISTVPAGSLGHQKPIVFYGTSITQGACASRPGLAMTNIVGRRLDVPIINLGFSGSGRMEPVMADLLAELAPAVYVLDCLPNMRPNEVAERVEPFVKRLRQAHPDTPILLAEDPNFENICPTEKGRILRTIYDKLTAAGVKNLHFTANKGMLGEDTEGTVDGGHPNDLGMMRQAEVFIKSLRSIRPISEK